MRNPMLFEYCLRTEWGSKVLVYLAEVLPMVSDFLTALSFAVLCSNKALTVISHHVGDI